MQSDEASAAKLLGMWQRLNSSSCNADYILTRLAQTMLTTRPVEVLPTPTPPIDKDRAQIVHKIS